jgi:hypothetical protein
MCPEQQEVSVSAEGELGPGERVASLERVLAFSSDRACQGEKNRSKDRPLQTKGALAALGMTMQLMATARHRFCWGKPVSGGRDGF